MSQLKSLVAGTAMALSVSAWAQVSNQQSLPSDNLRNGVQWATDKMLTADEKRAQMLNLSNFQTKIDGAEISGGIEYSKLRWAILKAGVAKMIGSGSAIAIDVKIWKDEKEILGQFGMNVAEWMMLKVSVAQLQQLMDFLFPSGMESTMMKQNTFGLTFRIAWGDIVKFFELVGYHIDTQGHNFGAKEYSIDTATLYQLFLDPRRVAGSRTNGVEWKISLVISEKNRISVEFTAGVISRTYQTLTPTPAETSWVVGAKLMFPLTRKLDWYIWMRHENLGNQRISAGVTGSWVKFEIYSDKGLGGVKNYGWMITWNMHINADFSSALPSSRNKDIAQVRPVEKENFQNREPVLYSQWIRENPSWIPPAIANTNPPSYQVADILKMVKNRPEYIPNTIFAKVDQTALPKLLVQIDKSVLPIGSTIDRVSGDVIISLPGTPGSIISATNLTTGNSVMNAFEIAGNSLRFKSRTLEWQLASGSNTIEVETTNQFITLTVEKWSVKLTNIVIKTKVINTTPILSAVSDVTVTSWTAGSIVLPAGSDTAWDTLTYSMGTLPVGFTFTPATRTLSWTAWTTAWTYNVNYTVTDQWSLTSSQNVKMVVGVAPDATPDAYTFTAQTNLQRSTQVDSAPITIQWINQPTAVTVTGGLVSINGGGFASSGTISNGQSLVVRLTTSANYNTPTFAAVTVGWVAATFTATTLANGAPTLAAVSDVNLTSGTAGSIVLPAGSDTAGDTLTYSMTNLPAGFTFTPATRTLSWTTAAAAGTSTAIYTVTDQGSLASSQNVKMIVAVAPDTTPDAYTFPTQTWVQRGATIDSAAVTISGINQATPISVTGGLVSINGGGFASSWTITNGQAFVIRLTASPNYATTTSATVNVGGVSATFSATTLANGAPTLSAVSDVTVTSWTAGSIVLPAGSDTAWDTLTYSMGTLPVGFTFTPATRTLSWTAWTTAWTYNVNYTVTDQWSLTSSQNVKMVVAAPIDNTPPVLTSATGLTPANIGATSFHTLTFNENIGSFTFGSLSPGMTASVTSISGSNVNISITTSASFTDFGDVNIPFTAKDASPAQNTLTGVNLTKKINDVAPVAGGAFAALANKEINDNDWLVTIDAGWATDSAGRTLIYSATGLPTGVPPEGFYINSSTWAITWAIDAFGDQTFNINVTVKATWSSLSTSKSFILTIRDIL